MPNMSSGKGALALAVAALLREEDPIAFQSLLTKGLLARIEMVARMGHNAHRKDVRRMMEEHGYECGKGMEQAHILPAHVWPMDDIPEKIEEVMRDVHGAQWCNDLGTDPKLMFPFLTGAVLRVHPNIHTEVMERLEREAIANGEIPSKGAFPSWKDAKRAQAILRRRIILEVRDRKK